MGKHGWTEADLKRLPPGMVKEINAGKNVVSVIPMPGKAKSKQSKEKGELALSVYGICKNGGFTLLTEYKFSKRRFKFDWAIPDLMIAIEYEGLMSDKSGHTTLVGYTSNCDKYNLAQTLGWRVLRYTAKNYKKAGANLLDLIEKTVSK